MTITVAHKHTCTLTYTHLHTLAASANDFASGSYPIVITAANQPGPECVDITTVDDLIHEGSSERFLLLLTAPSPQVFVDPPSGFVLIDDNDGKKFIVLSSDTILELNLYCSILLSPNLVIDLAIVDDTYFVNEGIGFVEVCVALSGERERTVTVDLFTDVGGTATGMHTDTCTHALTHTL